MRRSIATLIIVLGGILVLLMAGCYQPGGPVPEEKHTPAARDWTTEDVDAAVAMTPEMIYSPAPRSNGVPPAECDWIHYLRFRPRQASGNINDTDAVVVLIPGLLGGANSLEGVSRNLVYMALEQRGLNVEVWVVDRRPNNLEDLTGLDAAEQAHDTDLAIDYYYRGAEIGGRTFKGFLTDVDVPYLSEFGLELTMRDIYTVITTKVPDPVQRREKVFVGGHSMGGPYATYFAGWDFDGDPATLADAGYMNCAGLIGLDTTLTTNVNFFGDHVEGILGGEIMEDAQPDLAEEIYTAILVNLRQGSLPRMVAPATVIVGPETLALQELLAMEAAWHPDQESDLLGRVPYSSNVEIMLQMIHSSNMENFLFHSPSIADFRYTNEALFGLFVDDNFQMINWLQASVGFLNGGAVVEQQFPLPQDWANLPELFILKNFLNQEGQFIANDAGPGFMSLGSGPLYTWANFDEIGDASDPDYQDTGGTLTYTTAAEEVSDIQDVARIMYKGPANALEWYFTTRPFFDMAMASLFPEPGYRFGLNFFHGDQVAGMPQIDFACEKGPMIGTTDDLPPEIRVIEGYNHLDVCMAAPDRSSRRPNQVIDPILDFIQEGI